MTPRRFLIAVLLAIVAAAAPAAPALAQDNTAVAVNTKDDSSVFKLAFKISNVMQPVVENQNAAVAYASCSDCRTVAIAIQIVFIAGDADVVSPENVAIAINDGCTACETLAAAYQFVFGTGELMRLTSDGRKQINEIRRALRDLGKDDLPFEQVIARLDELTGQLRDVLKTEVVPVKPEDNGERDDDDRTDAEEPDATPNPEGTPEASPTPEATTTPSADPTSTATPSAEPTASATPTATP